MMSVAMDRAVHGVENIIGYTFDDPYLVWEAVSAAGSITSAGGRHFVNGNKRMAVVGDTLLQLALAESWYESPLERCNPPNLQYLSRVLLT